MLLLIALFDVVAWAFIYRAATTPPALTRGAVDVEEGLAPSQTVERRLDGMQAEISLNGTWRYLQMGQELDGYYEPDYIDRGWHTMEIPNNWFLAGLNYHGVIWFRREFQAEEAWRGHVVRLQFDGVDYFADVWLNGQPLGHHEGYFQPFTYDVSDMLNYGGHNVLAVRVESPYEEYNKVWHHHKTLIKGIFEHHDTRPGGGWGSAGQEYNTGGIWNNVRLVISDYITIDRVLLTPTLMGKDAHLKAEVRLTNHTDAAASAHVSIELVPRNFDAPDRYTLATDTALRPGRNTLTLAGDIERPHLWWPWDRGDPNLYNVTVQVTDSGQEVARRQFAFGFRKVKVDDDWTWTINGQRFFPRGSNYIGTQWLAETVPERGAEQGKTPFPLSTVVSPLDGETFFERDVRLMREANLNFIRVHAHVEPEAFYQAADEAGILVWQDFPLQWGYTDAPAFVDEALRQMRDMVELLYNHPSIVVWCAHNESPWDAPWMADRVPSYDPRQNKRLDQRLQALARELDPTRHVHLNSGTGDTHPYPGWYYGRWQDFANLPGTPMVTEYGAQALPNLETMQRMFTTLELKYDSGEARQAWEFHDFQPQETFDIAGVPRGESIEEFIANSQGYQANLIQFATESYRRAKYNPVQGLFHFMFVEDWPSITWAVVDYYRLPKRGFYALQTAMQPVLPSIEWRNEEFSGVGVPVYRHSQDFWANLWVVNDTPRAFSGAVLDWRIEDEAGQAVSSGHPEVDVPPDSAAQYATVTNPELASGTYTLVVTLINARGEAVGHNALRFEIESGGEVE